MLLAPILYNIVYVGTAACKDSWGNAEDVRDDVSEVSADLVSAESDKETEGTHIFIYLPSHWGPV